MDHVQYLVVGAGVSGLSFCNFIDHDDYLIVEADTEVGGYCKTIKQDGFVWDYSGHFFHFKDPQLEAFLLERMPDDEVRNIAKKTFVLFGDRWVDFPFQKNIHQLPQEDFIECLYDLFFKDEAHPGEATNFQEMLYQKFGKGITERFLVPYNEKLYACDLAQLDVDAMGRFFPWADVSDIIRNFKNPDNASYNATFTYPRGGAIQYIRALQHDLDDAKIVCGERVVSIDAVRKIATTNLREISFEYLVSSAPFDRFLEMVGMPASQGALSSNKVLVFNLGFDKKGPEDIHWLYIPERDYGFYRLGFYDNIFDTDRLSMYVEIGFSTDAEVDVDHWRERTLTDLRSAGVITDHKLVSEHHIVLDPAYAHITKQSQSLVDDLGKSLAARGIFSIGRYGAWRYCSIEDNIIEARELATRLRRVR